MSIPDMPSSTPSPADVAGTTARKTFRQAEIDRAVQKAFRRGKPADYDDVAAAAARSEDLQRQADALEGNIARISWETRRNELAAAHRVPDDLRDELMTATDDDTLQLQAERLAVVAQRERARGNIAPREGTIPVPADESDREVRDYVRDLFDIDDQ